MKRILFLFLCLFTFFSFTYGQAGSGVISTRNKEPFYLMINGVQYNQTPQTTIELENLNRESLIITIVLEDPSIAPLKSTFHFPFNKRTSYDIIQNKKGVLVSRLVGSTDL